MLCACKGFWTSGISRSGASFERRLAGFSLLPSSLAATTTPSHTAAVSAFGSQKQLDNPSILSVLVVQRWWRLISILSPPSSLLFRPGRPDDTAPPPFASHHRVTLSTALTVTSLPL